MGQLFIDEQVARASHPHVARLDGDRLGKDLCGRGRVDDTRTSFMELSLQMERRRPSLLRLSLSERPRY